MTHLVKKMRDMSSDPQAGEKTHFVKQIRDMGSDPQAGEMIHFVKQVTDMGSDPQITREKLNVVHKFEILA